MRLDESTTWVEVLQAYWRKLGQPDLVKFAKHRRPREDIDPAIWTGVTDIPTFEEFLAIISHTKAGGCPGPSGVTFDVLKHSTRQVQIAAYGKVKAFFTTTSVNPSETKGNIYTPPKIDAAQVPLDQRRPIALLNTTIKICSAILARRITRVVTKHQPCHPLQTAFFPGCTTTEGITSVRGTMELAAQLRRPPIGYSASSTPLPTCSVLWVSP